MDTLLVDAFGKFLAGNCTPAVVREVERTQQATELWAQIEASGYLDLLVPESADGAGLGLREAFDVWLACGQHALPVPLAQTMWLRGVLAKAGSDIPPGLMAIAPQCSRAPNVAVRCQAVPFGALADWVLVADAQGCALWPVAPDQRSRTGVHGSLQAHLTWPEAPRDALALPADVAWLHAGALLTATAMAGAMQRVLELTVGYANERSQFGKSIGKFQAVQQQLSVMAEQVFAARMAAQIGCASEPGDEIKPDALRSAVAKARASEAAQQVVAIAHAVHGAIGITGEYDLQLYTRRLQEWRGDFGSQAHWHAQLGAALLAAPQTGTLPFLLARLLPSKAV